MTGRDRLHRDRCGTTSIDPEDVRPDDNHPNDPPDDWSRPDLYDPQGAVKTAELVGREATLTEFYLACCSLLDEFGRTDDVTDAELVVTFADALLLRQAVAAESANDADPHGALAAPRWVDGRLGPDDDER